MAGREKGGAEGSAIQSGRSSFGARLDWTSVESLTESILRRIMRVACGVGTIGLLAAVLSPKPYNALGLYLGVAATVAVFAVTFLPVRVRILSFAYPFTLALLGASLTRITGPRPDAFLLVAGGVFIGSLVLGARGLALLAASTALALVLSVFSTPGPLGMDMSELWTSSSSAMVAVIVPAAVAGRALLRALTRTLRERQALFDEVVEERRALQATVHALESTRTQLTHAQKLELMSQLAGGIAHDMNNALTSVIGEASLLNDSVAQERERILAAGAYAAKLTHQLMVFWRRDTSQPRPIDLALTLRGFLQSIRRIVPSDIIVTTDVPTEPIAVVADSTQLLQVVLNVASNAQDAMHGGGELTLKLWRDSDTASAVIEIRDTGTGIAPENLERIFEPFFTTKPPGRGTGLGLANVKQLVDGLGGTIQVKSQLGEGSSFEIRIPTTEAEIVGADSERFVPTTRTGTVLVVDDDIRVRAVAFTALERAGHHVLEAANPAAALAALHAHRGVVDLVLTDVVMAGGGGAEVIRSIRAMAPNVRVLVMSGYADDEALRRGIAQGEYPFIAKPFTAQALVRAVASALAD